MLEKIKLKYLVALWLLAVMVYVILFMNLSLNPQMAYGETVTTSQLSANNLYTKVDFSNGYALNSFKATGFPASVIKQGSINLTR